MLLHQMKPPRVFAFLDFHWERLTSSRLPEEADSHQPRGSEVEPLKGQLRGAS